jgi:hypothetical protein
MSSVVKVCKFDEKEVCTVQNECLLSCPLNPGLFKKKKNNEKKRLNGCNERLA